MREPFEINGIKYEERPPRKVSAPKGILPLMALAATFDYVPQGQVGKASKELINKNDMSSLIAEFEKVQNKISGLSKSQRDAVEFNFHRNFREVKL